MSSNAELVRMTVSLEYAFVPRTSEPKAAATGEPAELAAQPPEVDALGERIEKFLAEPRTEDELTMGAIMRTLLGLEAHQGNQSAMNKVAKILRNLGYRVVRKRVGRGERRQVWQRG
jgi:hypothetical protein